LTVEYALAGGAPVALVTTPSGARVLVDSGPSATVLARAIDPLLPNGDRRIDLLVLTRMAPSTTGGTEGAVQRYRIAAIASLPAREPVAGNAAVVAVEPGSAIDLGHGARLEFDSYPGERPSRGGGRLGQAAHRGHDRSSGGCPGAARPFVALG
jgi:hypothetical protein